jgi:hypothetical protein
MKVHKATKHSKRTNNLGLNRRWKRLHTEIRLRGTTKNRFERREPKRLAYAMALAATAEAAALEAAQAATATELSDNCE